MTFKSNKDTHKGICEITQMSVVFVGVMLARHCRTVMAGGKSKCQKACINYCTGVATFTEKAVSPPLENRDIRDS